MLRLGRAVENVALVGSVGLLAGIALGHDRIIDAIRYGVLGNRPWDDAEPGSLESVRLTQNFSWSTPDAPLLARNGNCGPASVLMGVRLLGHDLTGWNGEHSNDVILAARAVAYGDTPDTDPVRGTTFTQMQRIATAAGVDSTISGSTAELEQAVRAGNPVVLAGDGDRSTLYEVFGIGDPRLGATPGGTHAVLVAGYDAVRGTYEVLDPAGYPGTLHVSPEELRDFSVDRGLILHRGDATAG